MGLGPWSHQLKFGHALQHFNVLEEEIQRFVNQRPWALAHDFDPETGENVLRLKMFRQPPVDWQLRTGDIFYNLRAVLDYLVFELSDGRRAAQPHEIYFPISSHSSLSALDLRAIERVSPGAQAVIKELQPYNSGDQPWLRELLRLHDFCNHAKHRLPTTVGVFVRESGLRVTGLPIDSMYGGITGPLEDGAEIARFSVSSDPNVDVDLDGGIEVIFGVAFEDGWPGEGALVVLTLKEMFEAVLRVLGRLERFLPGMLGRDHPTSRTAE